MSATIVASGDVAPVLEAAEHVRSGMQGLRNYVTYGPYRPANLEKHPQARTFFAAEGEKPS